MGGTQHTVGTANVRAYCNLLLATGNVGSNGTGANIFRGHCNVQGATDFGLDIANLPCYYGLAEGAWRHWGRVWDVPYDYFVERFDEVPAKAGRDARTRAQNMNVPGIPSTRWFDATLMDPTRWISATTSRRWSSLVTAATRCRGCRTHSAG
jgi:formate dehydrogenase major subunit